VLEAGAVAAVNKTASDEVLGDVIRSAARGEDPRLLGSLAADILITGEPLPQAPGAAPHLSAKELEVLAMVCRGYGYDEIAESLHLSVWTVSAHTRSLRDKLRAENLAQLVVRALQYNYYSA
jgi:two-component system response regulator NreC